VVRPGPPVAADDRDVLTAPLKALLDDLGPRLGPHRHSQAGAS